MTTARAADTDVTLIRFIAFDGATLARLDCSSCLG